MYDREYRASIFKQLYSVNEIKIYLTLTYMYTYMYLRECNLIYIRHAGIYIHVYVIVRVKFILYLPNHTGT